MEESSSYRMAEAVKLARPWVWPVISEKRRGISETGTVAEMVTGCRSIRLTWPRRALTAPVVVAMTAPRGW